VCIFNTTIKYFNPPPPPKKKELQWITHLQYNGRNLPTENNIDFKLHGATIKKLRKIFGPTKEDNGKWRIETNRELDELIKHRNIINHVTAQRLSWFGHTNRMPENSTVMKIYQWKPFTEDQQEGPSPGGNRTSGTS
jgi:hypothetical protein